MNSIKKISFIVPAYNAEKYIAECVDNILSVPYDNIQLVVVNDGSTDATQEILSRYDDKRLVVVEQENSGVSVARNNGIRHSDGEYIFFVDVDDIVIPQQYGDFLNKLDFDCDLYMFGYEMLNNGNVRKMPVPLEAGTYSGDSIKELCVRLFDSAFSKTYKSRYFGGKIYQYLYAREFLIKNGIDFPEGIHFAEDCIFCFKCFSKAERLSVVEDYLYRYVVYGESASHAYRPDFWNELKTVYQIACNIAGREIGHTNELYVYYGREIVMRITKQFIHKEDMAIEKISELLRDPDFSNAVRNTDYDKWTFSEKIMLNLFKNGSSEKIYSYMKKKLLLKKLFH